MHTTALTARGASVGCRSDATVDLVGKLLVIEPAVRLGAELAVVTPRRRLGVLAAC